MAEDRKRLADIELMSKCWGDISSFMPIYTDDPSQTARAILAAELFRFRAKRAISGDSLDRASRALDSYLEKLKQ